VPKRKIVSVTTLIYIFFQIISLSRKNAESPVAPPAWLAKDCLWVKSCYRTLSLYYTLYYNIVYTLYYIWYSIYSILYTILLYYTTIYSIYSTILLLVCLKIACEWKLVMYINAILYYILYTLYYTIPSPRLAVKVVMRENLRFPYVSSTSAMYFVKHLLLLLSCTI